MKSGVALNKCHKMKRTVFFKGNQQRKRKKVPRKRMPPPTKKKTLISNWVDLTYFNHKNYNGSRAIKASRICV